MLYGTTYYNIVVYKSEGNMKDKRGTQKRNKKKLLRTSEEKGGTALFTTTNVMSGPFFFEELGTFPKTFS